MKQVSIALLGCGTVGKGVIDVLLMNGPIIEEQPVSYTHLTLPTITVRCRSRWSPYH